jgi:hypothetical protein
VTSLPLRLMILRSRLKCPQDAEIVSDEYSSCRRKQKKRKITDNQDASDQHHKPESPIADMPMDVLFEVRTILPSCVLNCTPPSQVFKHLELADLLYLSRTSKALRSILLSRTSISLWKRVVANDGLPPCTEDLNEPQLAELMFGNSRVHPFPSPAGGGPWRLTLQSFRSS